MKVIDLLNKIANGEEVPKKIKCLGIIYEYSEIDKFYYTEEGYSLYREMVTEGNCLDDEVEIIEEDKEIEHYDMFDNFTGFGFGGTDKELLSDLQNNFEHINEELDYLIKAVNELKKGK